MRKTLTMAALLAASITAFTASATETALKANELVVSGGLTPIKSRHYGRAATVLDQEAIEARNERYAVDVLRGLPGVKVSRTGSFGGLTQVRLRGHEANHTLVLIDGVEVASPNQGEYDFSGLLSSDIARIEILRGPQSALYGSNAIGGVIAITTKGADEPGLSGELALDAGTDDTKGGSVALRGRSRKGQASLSVAHRNTGGFDVSGSPGGRDDGERNTTVNAKGQYQLAEAVTLGGTLRRVESRSDYDDFVFGAPTPEGLVVEADNINRKEELFGSLCLESRALTPRLSNRLSLSGAEIDSRGFSSGTKTSDSTDTRHKLSYQGTVALDSANVAAARQTLTAAAETERLTHQANDPAVVSAPGQLNKRERRQQGYVLEYQGRFENGFSLQGGLRLDNNENFEDFTTFSFGTAYLIKGAGTRLHASAGTGVQNPSLTEQFGFFDDFRGNPDLEPEQSEGFDAGIEQSFLDGKALVDVTYFQEALTDEIDSRPTGNGFKQPFNQDGESDRKGVELTGDFWITQGLDLGLNYTWLDAEDPDGRVEVRRPEHDIAITADYRLPDNRTTVGAEIQRVIGLHDLDFKTAAVPEDRVRLDNYTLVDLTVRHALTPDTRLSTHVNNLLDEDYEELEGYETQGITAYVGISHQF